jgi:hypothetical protein
VRRLDGPCRVDVGADPGFSNGAVHVSYYAAACQSFNWSPGGAGVLRASDPAAQ